MKIERWVLVAVLGLVGCSGSSNKDTGKPMPDANADSADADAKPEPVTLRVATYNVSMFREAQGNLERDMANASDPQAVKVAEVIQRVRPDILFLNEFDYDADQNALESFALNYLAVPQGGAQAIDYPFKYVFPSNTGVHSGQDLDNSGAVVSTPGTREYGGDAFGYGTFEGQYAFALLSKYPVNLDSVRSFRNFLWKDMPNNQLPTDWYAPEAQAVFRLSSKNHVDMPVDVKGRIVHVLGSHPTPPSFDGPEDRNGRRNHDEVRFWTDYVEGASYMTDDTGTSGGLLADDLFVIVGDLNKDPVDGGDRSDAIAGLLASDRTADPKPGSRGSAEAAESQGGANKDHQGDPATDTADWNDGSVGNMRVDYAIPSSNLNVVKSEVYWPAPSDENAALADASDHHMVWVDLTLP